MCSEACTSGFPRFVCVLCAFLFALADDICEIAAAQIAVLLVSFCDLVVIMDYVLRPCYPCMS